MAYARNQDTLILVMTLVSVLFDDQSKRLIE